MGPEMISFNDNQVTLPKVKTWILNNIPDFSTNITTSAKLDEFLGEAGDKDINRVILFSKKAKTPPIYKVLSATYRDKLRFGFISSENKELLTERFSNVTEFPTLLVQQSYDTDNKSVFAESIEIKYEGKKDYKLEELKEFLSNYARNEKKEVIEKEGAKKVVEEEEST